MRIFKITFSARPLDVHDASVKVAEELWTTFMIPFGTIGYSQPLNKESLINVKRFIGDCMIISVTKLSGLSFFIETALKNLQ
jgi:hypothetical protein